MELSLRNVFQDFNASKFVVFTSIFLFSVLFALRRDGDLDCPYWAVFIPLFVWKLLAVCGAIVGIIVHKKYPPSRNDYVSELEYRSMVLCLGEHILLLIFEALSCWKLEMKSETPLSWSMVFVPLFLQCLVSIVICIWAVRRDKSFEFELFFSVNILQFVFLSLKLDETVNWNWVIVFIPLWILICLSVIGVLYAIVLAVLLIRSIDLLPEHRRQHVYTAIGYTFLVVPILIFLVLLTSKLEGESKVPYVMVCTPLYISLVCLILMACGTRGGNQWWFGIRRDFCLFLLDSCPLLQEYGNVSYRFGGGRTESSSEGTPEPAPSRRQRGGRAAVSSEGGEDSADASLRLAPSPPLHTISSRDLKPVCPLVSIECPD